MTSTNDAPVIIVTWKPVTARYKPSGRHRDDQPWKATFWRADVAGVLFQVGNLPYSILDFSSAHNRQRPDQHPDSCWQLWFAEDQFDWPEYMAVLRGATEAEHALAIAQRYIEGYFSQKHDSLVAQLRQARQTPSQPHPHAFHDPSQLMVCDLEQRIERINQETRIGQPRLFF